jgi:hypothetical protein
VVEVVAPARVEVTAGDVVVGADVVVVAVEDVVVI